MKVYNVSGKKESCGLHLCLRHAMRLGRWTGFFPVQGLGQPTTEKIKFNLKCLYGIYHIATLFGQVLMTSFSLLYCLGGDVSLTSISNLVFYSTSLVAATLFMRLATHWPKLMKAAEETEKSFKILKMDHSAVLKSSTIAYVIMALALVEHLLCINFDVKFIMECLHEPIINNEVLSGYVLRRMPYIFNYISYTAFKAVLTEVLCMQSTFIWSFTDVVTICFSIYITSYFYTLNKVIRTKNKNMLMDYETFDKFISKAAISKFSQRLWYLSEENGVLSLFGDKVNEATNTNIVVNLQRESLYDSGKDMSAICMNAISWGQLRQHYSKLAVLVKKIDDQLSSFILLSFFTDLFFICLQLFKSLHRNHASLSNCGEEETKRMMSSPDYLLYYLYSFFFLVLRALLLSLSAANVHAVAQEPIFSIYDVPSSEYDQEVERFQSQLRFKQISLTGIFFCVTRNTILHAIGTIITYELVLLQFTSSTEKYTLGVVNSNRTIGVHS